VATFCLFLYSKPNAYPFWLLFNLLFLAYWAFKEETVMLIGFCSGTWIICYARLIFSMFKMSEEENTGRGSKHHEHTMLGVQLSLNGSMMRQ